MFEKSIHAMNNIDPTEDDNEENSKKSRPNEVNPPSRNGVIKRLNGNVLSRDPSSKPTCTVSWTLPFFFNVNRYVSLYIIFYYSRESFRLLLYENHLHEKNKNTRFSIPLTLYSQSKSLFQILKETIHQPSRHTNA